VQLVTTGLKLTDYRPAGADDAVDIRLRLPEDRRTLSTLDELRIETSQGSVPISNFVSREPAASVGTLTGSTGCARSPCLPANLAEGIRPIRCVRASSQKREGRSRGCRASAGNWRVEDEEQKAAGEFLSKAFGGRSS
jgi:multidrug efflux pump